MKIAPSEDFPVVGHLAPEDVAGVANALSSVPQVSAAKGFAIPAGDFVFSKGKFDDELTL